jgi:hypothetical protein
LQKELSNDRENKPRVRQMGIKYLRSPKCIFPGCNQLEQQQHVVVTQHCRYEHPELKDRMENIRKIILEAFPTKAKNVISEAYQLPRWWHDYNRQASNNILLTDTDLQELARFDKKLGSLAIIPKALTRWLRKHSSHLEEGHSVEQIVRDIHNEIAQGAHSMWRERCRLLEEGEREHRKKQRESDKEMKKALDEMKKRKQQTDLSGEEYDDDETDETEEEQLPPASSPNSSGILLVLDGQHMNDVRQVSQDLAEIGHQLTPTSNSTLEEEKWEQVQCRSRTKRHPESELEQRQDATRASMPRTSSPIRRPNDTYYNMYEQLQELEDLAQALAEDNLDEIEQELRANSNKVPEEREQEESSETGAKSKATENDAAQEGARPPPTAAEEPCPEPTTPEAPKTRSPSPLQKMQRNKRNNAYGQEETDQERPRSKRGTTRDPGTPVPRDPPPASLEMHFAHTLVPPADTANTPVRRIDVTDTQNASKRSSSTLENEDTPRNNREQEEPTLPTDTPPAHPGGTHSTTNASGNRAADKPTDPRVTEINQMVREQATTVKTEINYNKISSAEHGQKRRRRPPDRDNPG